MKRILLSTLLLIALLFTLTGCSNNETTKSSNTDQKEDIISEELEIDGTGKINLKELIDSPKLANKTWHELNMSDVKTFFNVNENNEYNTKKINDQDISAYFSNDGKTTTTSDNGDEIETKNEYISIDNYSNSRVHMLSENVPYENEFPENLKILSYNFSTLLKDSSLTAEQQNEIFNKAEIFMPYITKHNCKTIEDFAKTLGFEETDKSMLFAIKNNIEYYADYESDYGKISIAYLPSKDMDSKVLSFDFEDESSWLKNLEISFLTGMNDNIEFEELQISFRKK